MMSPEQHFAAADALLARVKEMGNDTLPIVRCLVAQAQAHATLAACPEWWGEAEPTHYAYRPYPPETVAKVTGERL